MIKVDLSPETITYSGDRFMKNKRRNHSAQFKAKVELDSIGICTNSENRQYAQIVISSEVEKSF